MSTSNPHIALLAAVCSLVLTPGMGLAQVSEEWERQMVVSSTQSVNERGTEPSPDPWTVTNPASLFSRPTFGEVVKFSAEATEEGSNYSANLAPAGLLNSYNRYLMGLQVLGAFSQETETLSVGFKWNLSLRDIRFFSKEKRQKIFDVGELEFQKCEQDLRASPLPEPVFIEGLKKCGMAQLEEQTKALEEAWKFRPTLSIGASAAYGLETERWGKVASNVAVEFPISSGFSFVVNGDFESDRGDDGLRHPSLGGSLAATYLLPVFDERLRAGFAGRVLECLDNCSEEASTVRFGPSLNVTIGEDKDSAVGLSLSWSGKGESAGDAFLGLSFTHSIGPIQD